MDAAKPVARRLGPFLDQARVFAADGAPTDPRPLADDRAARAAQRPDRGDQQLPAARAVGARRPARVNGAERPGAFPETAAALRAAAPTIALGRPYTPDFVGWLDDFSTTGAYDALGEYSRAWINLSEFLYGPGPEARPVPALPGRERSGRAPTARTCSSAAERRSSTATRARGRWAREARRRSRWSVLAAVRARRRPGARRHARRRRRGPRPTRSCSTTPSGWPRAATSRSPACAPARPSDLARRGPGAPAGGRRGEGHGARLRRPARATRTARSGRSRSSASTSCDCQPGTSPRADPRRRARARSAQTSSTIGLDLVNNILRRPYRTACA